MPLPLGKSENRRIGTAAPPFKTIEHGKQPGVWVGTKEWRGERAQTAQEGTGSIVNDEDDDISDESNMQEAFKINLKPKRVVAPKNLGATGFFEVLTPKIDLFDGLDSYIN